MTSTGSLCSAVSAPSCGSLLDASLDPSFGGDGIGQAFLSPRDGGFATDDAGDIVVVGTTGGCTRGCYSPDTTIQRLTPSGEIDGDFGRRGLWGWALLDIGAKPDGARDVALEDSGRPVLVGFSGGRMMAAGIQTKPGPPDYDGDGLRDRADFCAQRYSHVRAGKHPGCPVVRPRLTLSRRSGADLWVGRSISPEGRCAPDQTLRIYREQPGRDDALAEATYAGDGSFQANGNLTPALTTPPSGTCSTATSAPVTRRSPTR